MAAKLLKLVFLVMVLAGLLVACTVPPPSPQPAQQDLTSLVNAYQKAENAHDLDAIMAMFTKDPVFEMVGMGKLVGQEEVRAFHDYAAGLHVELNFSNCTQEGDTVTCKVTERNDWQRAAQIPEYHYTSAVFTFQDGKIQSIAATMSPDSGQILGATLKAVMQWAQENRPEELAKLFDENGHFIYSRESASIEVGLLKAWRARHRTK